VVGAAHEAALVPSRRTIALAEVPRPIVPVRLGPVDWALATRLRRRWWWCLAGLIQERACALIIVHMTPERLSESTFKNDQ
jgi:hypothetical protein